MADIERDVIDQAELTADEAAEAVSEAPAAQPKKKKGSKKRKKKKAGVGTWIYRGVLLVLVGVMVFSGVKVATIYSGYSAGTKVYDEVAESAISKSTDSESDRLVIDWEALLAQNDDVVGWIRCPGTVINYPIVQGEDNEYYLEFLINGDWNAKGTPFVDIACPSPFKDYLTVVYGHRMRDGSMFASLLNYFSEATYYEQFPKLEIYTPDGDYDMEIVSGAKVDSHDMSVYRFGEYGADQNLEYANMVMAANRIVGYNGDAQLDGTERLVLLSTCTPQSDNMRFVIWGRLVPMADE